MKINTFVNKILNDINYRQKKARAFNNYKLFENKKNIIDEDIFLEFIEKMQNNDELLSIYRDISICLLTKENLTNKVFQALVDMAKKPKFSFCWVYLCHATDIDKDQIEYLKSLKLNEVYWY